MWKQFFAGSKIMMLKQIHIFFFDAQMLKSG